MIVINNGINLYGGLKIVDLIFLVFLDYVKGVLRLGVIMKFFVVYLYLYDLYLVGDDGLIY